ncbi:MAG: alpha/beta hydrolase [Thermoleophilia bacterium]|nr:alpha/beta hydrolase [Thermoleophilia bacterium]
MTRTALALAALAALAMLPGGARAAEGPCPDDATERCGTLTVPLDRSGALAGTLDLAYRVRPAGRGPRRGVMLFLAGGPGEAFGPQGRELRTLLGDLAPALDVVTMDTRGTGAGALRCAALDSGGADGEDATAARVAALVARCAGQIGPRRAAFTSLEVADDIEALREALGTPTLTLAGVSYGTLVAQVYARRHPAGVERLVLDSVVDDRSLDGSGAERLAAARRILRELCAGGACREAGGDVLAATGRLDARLSRRAVRAGLVSRAGRVRTVRVGGPARPQVVLNALLAGDLNPSVRGFFPGAVRAALAGDAAPLVRVLDSGPDLAEVPPRAFSLALFAATVCRDTAFPWGPGIPLEARAGALAARAAGVPDQAFRPWSRATLAAGETSALCLGWPDDPAALPDAPLPDVPALLLSGRQDVRTPLESARAVAARLPRARLVAVPGRGHSLLANEPCARAALARFLAGRDPGRACERLAAIVVPPAPVARFAALRPVAGLPPRPGRAVRGAAVTLAGLGLALPAFATEVDGAVRMRGLRGGTLRLVAGGSAARLTRYSDVPGVTLTGTLGAADRSGTFRVGGVVSGTLRISPRGLRGRVGGADIDLPFPARR